MKVVGDVRYDRKVGDVPEIRVVRGIEIFGIEINDIGLLRNCTGMFMWCSRKFEASLVLARTETLRDGLIWNCPDQGLPARVKMAVELPVEISKAIAYLEQTYACVPRTAAVMALIADTEREIYHLVKERFPWID